MSIFRTNNTITLTAGQTGSLANAWGILPVSGATGVLTIQPQTLGATTATTMSISHLAPGVPFPCYIRSVAVASGTVYVLA